MKGQGLERKPRSLMFLGTRRLFRVKQRRLRSASANPAPCFKFHPNVGRTPSASHQRRLTSSQRTGRRAMKIGAKGRRENVLMLLSAVSSHLIQQSTCPCRSSSILSLGKVSTRGLLDDSRAKPPMSSGRPMCSSRTLSSAVNRREAMSSFRMSSMARMVNSLSIFG